VPGFVLSFLLLSLHVFLLIDLSSFPPRLAAGLQPFLFSLFSSRFPPPSPVQSSLVQSSPVPSRSFLFIYRPLSLLTDSSYILYILYSTTPLSPSAYPSLSSFLPPPLCSATASPLPFWFPLTFSSFVFRRLNFRIRTTHYRFSLLGSRCESWTAAERQMRSVRIMVLTCNPPAIARLIRSQPSLSDRLDEDTAETGSTINCGGPN
jgi:hypothetical protein